MTYKDMTFCLAAENCKTALQGDCHRYFDEDHQENALLWAKRSGLKETLVAYSDFSARCDGYDPVSPEWKHVWSPHD